MTQEITVTKVEDHYEMEFDGGNAYPVPENAIEELDDDLTPAEVGEAVTFVGEYGGHKHMKNFDVVEVVEGPGEADENSNSGELDDTTDEADASDDEVAPVDERFDVGDRVENPSQRRGTEYEVVDIREKQTFDGTETVLVVKRVGQHGSLKGKEDIIYEKYHENWRAIE